MHPTVPFRISPAALLAGPASEGAKKSLPKGPTMALRTQASVIRPFLALILSLSVPVWSAEPTGPALEVPDLADPAEDSDPPPVPRDLEAEPLAPKKESAKKTPETKKAPDKKAEPEKKPAEPEKKTVDKFPKTEVRLLPEAKEAKAPAKSPAKVVPAAPQAPAPPARLPQASVAPAPAPRRSTNGPAPIPPPAVAPAPSAAPTSTPTPTAVKSAPTVRPAPSSPTVRSAPLPSPAAKPLATAKERGQEPSVESHEGEKPAPRLASKSTPDQQPLFEPEDGPAGAPPSRLPLAGNGEDDPPPSLVPALEPLDATPMPGKSPSVSKSKKPPSKYDPPAEQSISSEPADDGSEVIRERYPTGRVRIERQVTQDSEGNYVNHGLWTMWDPDGRVLCCGENRYGKREGKWMRLYKPGEGPMFNSQGQQGFQPPFLASATFVEGVLDGEWNVQDSRGAKMLQWKFEGGQPHGPWFWFHPNGKKLRECKYDHGTPDGLWLEWAADGQLAVNDAYITGQKLTRMISQYPSGQLRSEETYLFTLKPFETRYDFLEGSVTTTGGGPAGPKVRHGICNWYHANGQKQLEGEYNAGQSVGTFTWWYDNGQKQLMGSYVDGKPQGTFTWWFANGQKQQEISYEGGAEVGKYVRWTQDGKVAETGRNVPAEETDASHPTAASSSSTPMELDSSAAAKSKRRTK